MIALTPAQRTLFQGAHYGIHFRVWVRSHSGALVDLTEEAVSATYESSIDALVDSLTVRFDRGVGASSMAPLMTANPPLDLGREIVFEVAAAAIGAAPTPSDYFEVFRGYIRSIDPTREVVEVVAHDPGGLLQQRWIEKEEEYGADDGTALLQQVMQAQLTKWAPGVTLHVPAAPGAFVPTFTQQIEPTLEAQRALAESIGWVARYWRDPVSGQRRFTLLEPPRGKTAVDWTFRPNRYLKVEELRHDDADVRNRILVQWPDSDGEWDEVVREDAASIAKHGGPNGLPRTAIIREGSGSPVKSLSQATALAEAVLSDLAEPDATHAVEDLALPFLELWDLCAFEPNNVHYSAEQRYAIMRLVHDFPGQGKGRTTAHTRGKPSGGVLMWRRRGLGGEDAPEPFGNLSTMVDSEGRVSFSFSGNDRARSFRWAATTGAPAEDPADATVEDMRSGERRDVLTIGEGEVGYISGWWYSGANGEGDRGPRVVAIAGGQGDVPALLALLNFRETRVGEVVRYEWEPGERVHEVWVYRATYKQPITLDPWPRDRAPDVVLPREVMVFEQPVPGEGEKTYLQFEPRDDSLPPIAGEVRRATIEGLPSAKPEIASIVGMPSSTVGPDLSNVRAVITDPLSRAGRLTAWLNYSGHASPNQGDEPDGTIDVTLTDGARVIHADDVWELTGGGTGRLFRDLTVDADLGKTIYLQWTASDGAETAQVSAHIQSRARILDEAFGELLPDALKYGWQVAREIRPPALLPEIPTGNPDEYNLIVVDGKLYRWDGSGWTAEVETVDLVGQLTEVQIATGAITTTKIADDAITTPKLVAGAVQAGNIAALAVTAGKLAANAVTADKLAANAVTADKINANAITSGKIAAGAIAASSMFVSGVVDTAAIKAGAVVADKINVTHLSAITQGMGIMVTGGFHSATTAAGIRIDTGTAAPSTWGWQRYLDLAATGAMPVLRTPRVSINADGSIGMGPNPVTNPVFTLDSNGNATFAGTVASNSFTAPTATFSGVVQVGASLNFGATQITADVLSFYLGNVPLLQVGRLGAGGSIVSSGALSISSGPSGALNVHAGTTLQLYGPTWIEVKGPIQSAPGTDLIFNGNSLGATGQINFMAPHTTAAGSHWGFITVKVNGTLRKIPYYAV